VPEDDELGQPEGGLRETPRYLWRVMRTAVDYLALNTETGRDLMVRAKPYPDPFVFSHLQGHAGAELGCWVGMRDEPAPMIVFVPGTFATKDAGNTRAKVMRLFEETGAHLCALDLRGFGHSADLRSTAGYLESMDVAHVAESFREDERVTEVVLAGESLGGSTAITAGRRAEDGVAGVLAVNPFADLTWILRTLMNRPPRLDPTHVVHQAFQTFLRHVTGDDEATFGAYVSKAADSLGLSVEEVIHRASPRNHVGETSAPTLVLHATDDPVVPAFHALVLHRAAAGNDNVQVHLTEMGGHASFDVIDEDWYWDTVTGFVDRVTRSEEGPA
jgi:pimeloyl-ACP methyl ester carboxylesterase